MKQNNLFLRVVIGIIGLNIMGFGIALIAVQNIGAFPVETFTFNLIHFFPSLTKFLVSFLYNFLFIIPLFLYQLAKRKINYKKLILGIIPALVLSFPIDLFCAILPQTDNFIFRFILMIVGFFVSCFGIALFQVSNAFNFYNMELIETIYEDHKIAIFWMKILNDLLTLFAGLLLILNGARVIQITFGTIFLTFGTGIFIDIFMRLFRKNKTIRSFR